jgi:serine/threonine-protein kinase
MDASASDRDPVERLAEEFLERHRRGEEPDVAEYTARYPEWADAILELFPALVMMEQMRPVSENVSASRTSGLKVREIGTGKKLERLGDYRILREVGRGGMGRVYEAVQESLGRHVALKILPLAATLDSRHRRRFEREARASARLHHTNIVPVFGVGEDDGLLYYVMQFIQGQSLDLVLTELHKLRKASTRSTDPATDPRAKASAPLPTAADRAVGASAADIAAQLLSGEFTFTRSAPGAEGGFSFGLSGTAPFTSPTGGDQTQPLRTEKLVTAADHSSELPPTFPAAPEGPVAAPSGSAQDSSHTSGRLTGSATSLGLSQSYRHYAHCVARIGVQVCDALHYAHGQGIVHRDVKPSNLLLDLQGTVWVTDFGLAKAADEEDLTHTGDVLGTLRYMAPERFQGSSDARSDIYALGLTLYEMLALRPAFEGSERNSLIRMVTTEVPPALRKLDARVPRDLETIVTKAIDREPARRYQTAADLGDDLRSFVEDKPIRARRIQPMEQLWRWSRRNPALAIVSSVLLLLLCAVAVGSSVAAWWFQSLARSESLARRRADLQTIRADQQLLAAVAAGRQAEQARQQAAAERDRAEAARADALANLGEAQRQRQRALESFQQARAAVDESLTRISENTLLNVPGLRPLRKELIEAALRYYEGFVRQRSDDPELRQELAAAYARVGRITADLGSKEDGLRSYRQSIQIQTELERRAKEPERPRALAELARSQQAVGRLQRDLNRLDEAESTFALAEKLWERASRSGKGDPEFQTGLADCKNDAGALDVSAERLEPAVARYRDALLIERKLVADHAQHPGIARFRHVLARQYLRMGILQTWLKLTPETFVHVLGSDFPLSSDPLFFYKESQQILRGLVRDFPNDENKSEMRRDLAEATEKIAAFFAGRNQLSEALEGYHEALAIREELARENPTVAELQAELARAYSALGVSLSRQKRWSEALPQFARAVERQQMVVMLTPGDAAQLAALGRREGELGRTEAHLGRTAEALRDLGAAREIMGQLSSPGTNDLYDLAALSAAQSTLVASGNVGADAERAVANSAKSAELAAAAVTAFERAIAAGFLDLERARDDPDLGALRARPDFQDLLDRLGRIRRGIVWVLDMEQARAQAAAEKKDLFIYFTGSDWCPWCVLFERTIISSRDFIEEVPKHFVMVELDSPQTKPKPANFAEIQELTRRWQIESVPTVILADAQGKPFARFRNDPTEEARAKYIENLLAARNVRASRDDGLAKASSAQGLERAKRLDAALRILPSDLVESSYGDLIAQIVALDASDAAGLRTRYAGSREARIRTEASVAAGKRDWNGVCRLYSSLKSTRPSAGSQPLTLSSDDLFERGTAQAELGRLEEAWADFARALDCATLWKPPQISERLGEYALLLAATGRLDEFRLTCEGLLKLASSEPHPFTAQAVLLALRLAPSAVSDWKRAVELAEPKTRKAEADPFALRILGQIQYRAGRLDEAIKVLNRAVALYDADPKLQAGHDADGLFSIDGPILAMAHHSLGHDDDARRILDQAKQRWERMLKIWQKDPAHQRNRWNNRLASTLLLSEAEALIGGAGATDDPVEETARARAQSRLGQRERALAHLDRALKLLPGDLRLKLERGDCLARLGRQEQAAADRAEVIKIKLQTVATRSTPGQGQFPALDDLEALTDAYHDLAATQREAGLADEAAATYRKIAALWPGHPMQLFRVARGLARCLPRKPAPGSKPDSAGSASSDEQAAIAVLKQAALVGFADARRIQVTMSFEPLVSRPEYQSLLQQLQRSEVLPLASGELRRYIGHQNEWVEGVAVARDGRVALSVGDDQKPRLWDVASGRELRQLEGHQAPVYGVAISPDGQRAVTSSRDGTLRVWDLGSGRELRRIDARSGRDQKLALSPEGRQVLAGQTDGTLALWDIHSGALVRQFQGSADRALSVALSADGRRALSGGRDGAVSLWDVATGRLIKRFQGHRGTVWSVTFSPDGKGALTGGGDGRLILWDLESGQPLRDFTGHWAPVRSVAVLRGGHQIVSGDQAGRLIVWDLETGRELFRLNGRAGILGLDPLPDGRAVLTAEANGIVRLRDLSRESARFRDLAGLGQWDEALSLNPTPRDPRVCLALAWYRAANKQWDNANADTSLAARAADAMGLRPIPLLDPNLEGQLRSGRGPAASVILINLTRRFFNGFVLNKDGRREPVFTLDVGEGFSLPCEAKDCFLMAEKHDKPLGIFIAGTGVSLLVVTEASSSPEITLPRDPDYVNLLLQVVAAQGPSKPAQAFLDQIQKQVRGDPRLDRALADARAHWSQPDKPARDRPIAH